MVLAAAVALGSSASLTRAGSDIELLPAFPSSSYYIQTHGVSADGSTLYADDLASVSRSGVRWSTTRGFDLIYPLAGTRDGFVRLTDISGDGAIITGYTFTDPDVPTSSLTRWSPSTGWISTAAPANWTDVKASAIDRAGNVIAMSASYAGVQEVALWSAASGFQRLGRPSSLIKPVVNDLSANDASVIVGDAYTISYAMPTVAQTRGYRYTRAGGFQMLPALGGNSAGSHASAVTADGSVVFGTVQGPSGFGTLPARWVNGGPAQLMAGEYDSIIGDPSKITPDGSLALGLIRSGSRVPLLWQADGDVLDGQRLLLSYHGRSADNVLYSGRFTMDDIADAGDAWIVVGSAKLSSPGGTDGTENHPYRIRMAKATQWQAPASAEAKRWNDGTNWNNGDRPGSLTVTSLAPAGSQTIDLEGAPQWDARDLNVRSGDVTLRYGALDIYPRQGTTDFHVEHQLNVGSTAAGEIARLNLVGANWRAGSSAVNSGVTIGGTNGGSGVLNITSGRLTTNHLSVVNAASNRLRINGGALTLGTLDLGGNPDRLDWVSGELAFTTTLRPAGDGPLGADVRLTPGRVLTANVDFAAGQLHVVGGRANLLNTTIAASPATLDFQYGTVRHDGQLNVISPFRYANDQVLTIERASGAPAGERATFASSAGIMAVAGIRVGDGGTLRMGHAYFSPRYGDVPLQTPRLTIDNGGRLEFQAESAFDASAAGFTSGVRAAVTGDVVFRGGSTVSFMPMVSTYLPEWDHFVEYPAVWSNTLVVGGTLTIEPGATFQITLAPFPAHYFPTPYTIGYGVGVFEAATIVGRFDNFILPAPAGLRWDTSVLYTRGVLTLVSVPEPSALALSAAALMLLARRRCE